MGKQIAAPLWGMSPGRDHSPHNHEADSAVDIPPDIYRAIEQEIASVESPVGIDAKKTHVMILHQLAEIERRLASIEGRLGRS